MHQTLLRSRILLLRRIQPLHIILQHRINRRHISPLISQLLRVRRKLILLRINLRLQVQLLLLGACFPLAILPEKDVFGENAVGYLLVAVFFSLKPLFVTF